MLPISMLPLYCIAAYLIWYFISRLSLIAAWVYARPGTFTWRHYVTVFIGMCPFVYEIVASILVVFAFAFGVSHDTKLDLK